MAKENINLNEVKIKLIKSNLLKNIKCKYYNNFISQSKCSKIVKGVYDNHKELVDLITNRENSVQMFQSACVNDYDSKQKMESKRSNSSSSDEKVNLSDDKMKIDSRGDSVKIEGNSTISIDSSSQKDRLIE